MVLTKKQKQQQIDVYVSSLEKASNVVLFVQKGVDVNVVNEMRKELGSTDAQLVAVRKRLFLRAIDQAGYGSVDLQKVDGTVYALFSYEDEFSPLKAVHKTKKAVAKLKKEEKSVTYMGGWYEKDRKDADYVTSLADLPSKEELVGKFLYLLKYPVQSFAAVLNQIAEKGGAGEEAAVEAPAEGEATEVAETPETESAEV